MTDFRFSVDFDWSAAGRSTRAYIQEVQAELERLASLSGRGSVQARRRQTGVLANQIESHAPFRGQTRQPATPGEEAFQKRLETFAQSLTVDPKAVGALGASIRQRVAEVREITAQEILSNDAMLQALTNQLLAERQLTATTKRMAEEQTDGVLLQEQTNAEIARQYNAVRRNVGVRTAQVGDEAFQTEQAQLYALNRVNRNQRNFLAQKAIADLYFQGVPGAREAAEEDLSRVGADTRQALAAQQAADAKAAVEAARLEAKAQQQAEREVTAAKKAEAKAAREAALAEERARKQSVDYQADQLASRRLTNLAVQQQAYNLLRTRAVGGDQEAISALAGTRFQRIQAGIAARSTGPPRLPSEFQTLGQFFQSKALTTAGFAVSGAAFYGIYAGARKAVDEAVKLQTNLALIEEQLNQAGQGDEFVALREGILAAARDTGILSSEMSFLALQLRGAFADQAGRRGSIEFVNEQLQAAGEIARVTGLPLAETTDSLTAITKVFNTTFRDIGDVTLGLQQRFGVLSKEIITFTADLAPVAAEAGISFEKLAAIGATVQRLSGRTGTSLAEAIGRILPSIQDNATDILGVYTQLAEAQPRFARQQAEVTNALAGGQTGIVFERLIRDFERFGQVQQNAIISALGGRREASTLQAIFGDTTALIREFNRADRGATDRDQLSKQFERLGDTAGQAFAELEQALLQIGAAVLNLGILELLTDVASVAKTVAQVFGDILDVLQTITGILNFGGEFPLFTQILQMGALVGGIALLRRGNLLGSGSGAASRLTLLPGIEQGAARQGATIGQRIGESINRYRTNLFTAITQNVARSAAFAGGTAAAVGGSQLGGDAGSLLTALGTGVATGAVAGPLAGIVVGGASILTSFLESARRAKEESEALAVEYADLAETRSGRRRLEEIATSGDVVKTRGILGFENPLDPGKPSPEVVEAQKALQESTIERFRRRSEAILSLVDPKSDFGRNLAVLLKNTSKASLDQQEEDYPSIFFSSFQTIIDGLVEGIDPKKFRKRFREVIQGRTTESLAKRGLLGESAKFDLASYDAGETSFAELDRALQRRRSDLTSLLPGAEGEQLTNFLKAMSELDDVEEEVSKRLRDRVDFITALRDRADGGQFTLVDLGALLNLLKNKRFRGPEQQLDVVNDIFDGLQQVLDDQIDTAQTAAEKLRIAQLGIAVPEPAQLGATALFVRQMISFTSLKKREIIAIAEAAGLDAVGLYEQIAAFILFTGASVREATIAILNSTATQLTQQIIILTKAVVAGRLSGAEFATQLNALNGQIAAVNSLVTELNKNPVLLDTEAPDVSRITASPSQIADLGRQAAAEAERAAEEAARAAEEARRAARDLAEAQVDYLRALIEGNPVEEARLDIRDAEIAAQFAETEADSIRAAAQKIRAERALFEAVGDTYAANGDFLQALAANDPLAVAKISFEQAKLAIALARGDAERLRAQAQAVEAFKSIEQAIFDIAQSQIELLTAFSQAAGDAVTVAQLQLRAMQEQLAFAVKTGTGEAEINRIRAQIVSGEAALRDAQLQKQLDTIDFNLEVENISRAQAIAQLEALLASASVLNLTEQQQRDLILKIRQLRQELSQDLQFDLPSELRLPTLYETRRLAQSGGAYQDNRTITIELNATNAIEGEQAIQTIIDAINDQPVYGSTNRIY